MWIDTKTEQEYTVLIASNSETKTIFLKQCQIKMYAVVKLTSGVGLYELISGAVASEQLSLWDRSADSTELFFDDRGDHLDIHTGGVQCFLFDKTPPGFTTEWYLEYYDASPTKRLEMETAFVQSAANAGRGWNSTRRDVLEQFVAQLH